MSGRKLVAMETSIKQHKFSTYNFFPWQIRLFFREVLYLTRELYPPPPFPAFSMKTPTDTDLRFLSNNFISDYCPKGVRHERDTRSHAKCLTLQLTDHNIGINLDQRFNPPVHGRCGERRSPNVQPSTRRRIEPGTSWLAIRDLTNCANLTRTADPEPDPEPVSGPIPIPIPRHCHRR